MEAPQPSFFAVLPANIRYSKKLTSLQKLLYAEVSALCNKEGYCWANNEYFAGLYGKRPDYISRCINKMIKLGFLKSEIDVNSRRKLFLVLAGDSEKSLGGYRKITRGVVKNHEHNNINNNINNTFSKENGEIDNFTKPLKVKKSYGKPEINELISYLRETMELPFLDGSDVENRRYAESCLKRFKGKDNVKRVIDTASEDAFYRSTITSFKSLFNSGLKIVNSKSLKKGYR